MPETQLNHKEINNIFKDVQKGSTTFIQQILEKYPSFHWSTIYYDKTGDTILHIAARLGHVNIIKYLMNNFEPKAVNCKNKDDKTALHESAQFGQFEACKTLINYGANVNAIKRSDWTPLMLACTKVDGSENYKIVKLLLESGAFVNYKNKDGWSCLHLICREGNVEILKLLIKYSLDLKAKSKNGRTGLHVAALHGNLEIVKILLELGFDANETDNCGNSSLHEAVLCGNVDICKILITRGAHTHFKNNSDYGLLHLAASQGHMIVLKFLLDDLKWNINETNNNGLSALHCAARKNMMDTYNFLVDNGADPSILDNFKRKPIDYLLPT